MRDIYDGKICKEFQNFDGKPFLSQQNSYALMLNVDWFNPFKHSPGSIGALYCVFANLPRNERYKRENIVLLALIEGEPKHDLNAVLKPIVDELISLWNGHRFWVKLKLTFVRVALLCVACDVPAARKVAGFLSHNAKLGCSRCLKQFPVSAFGERPDYSGFERDSWPKRNADQHRIQAFDTLKATSESKRKEMERKFGSRYTELLRLPYYDCIRFVIIDPMHNLLLGTAKHMFHTWTEKGILKSQDLKHIQEHIDSIVVPPDVGRIPNELESRASGMTADQWKNWTLIYSPYILSNFLPKDHYKCWMLFVSACRILCGRTISIAKLHEADNMLLSFCRSAENLYGKNSITPNMHLHCHLAECILDYGPVYAFWCFSFERYNGILGTYQHNNRAIPIQMMRKFLEDECLTASDHASSQIFTKYFSGILENKDESVSGTLQQIFNGNSLTRDYFSTINPCDVSWKNDASKCHSYPPMRTKVMDDSDYEDLKRMYQILLGNNDNIQDIYVPRTFLQTNTVEAYGEIYDSRSSPAPRASHIISSWFFENSIVCDVNEFRPAVINYFMKHCIEVKHSNGDLISETYLLASVSWFKPHGKRNNLHSPLEIWCKSVFEEDGPASFLPVGRISCRFCPIEGEVTLVGNQQEKVLVVNPLQQKWAAE